MGIPGTKEQSKGEVKGNFGGPYFGGFLKSPNVFLTMYFYSLQMSFYDGSNSPLFTLGTVHCFNIGSEA